MKFIALIQALEHSLGYHHVPFNRNASTLSDLFDGTPVQSEFVIKFVRAVYKENQCASLKSKITKKKTENCLAEIRHAALQSKNIDIDTFNFIEDLCQAIDKIFKDSALPERSDGKTSPAQAETIQDLQQDNTSTVISINQKRHRRWLKSSA